MLTYLTVSNNGEYHKHDLALSVIPCQLLGCWLDVQMYLHYHLLSVSVIQSVKFNIFHLNNHYILYIDFVKFLTWNLGGVYHAASFEVLLYATILVAFVNPICFSFFFFYFF